ncbi:MAG: UvrD-helicase domain-containing protein [Nitrospirales bacterium]|nr:UvrD-helicase domain-containing protein [Nitrospirales bacterium]
MSNLGLLPDADERLVAETTFDRNVVVLAGAGTGKTTLLVNRLIHAILREPHALRLTDMLALTFTNKAANEMKARLRDRLHGLLADCEAKQEGGSSGGSGLEEFKQRYHVSTDHVREKIQVALSDLEKSQIATLHSFAAHVLRLYPLEARVDPHFHEDEGTQFLETFQEAWDAWLEQELGAQGASHAQWQDLLNHVGLKEIRSFAFSLCQDQISIPELSHQLWSEGPSLAFRMWLQNKQHQVRSWLMQYDRAKPRKIEKLLSLAERVFDRVGHMESPTEFQLSDEEKVLLDSTIGQAPGEWDLSEFQDAKRAVQAAQQLLQVNEALLGKVIHVLGPFAARVRQVYSEKGWIRFDGLLIRVRDLLRDHPMVREQLKKTYAAIMVDEFQDTDPIQYEILLYLGECPNECRRFWRDIQLMPGKLFIVGDPKQSIYAFRRADIEAFDQVVEKIMHDGGIMCTLLTNFRSDEAILEAVNAVFDRLFLPQANVQPPNVPLAVGRMRETGSGPTGMEIFVMANPQGEDEWDAERATRVEAEWLAEWIEEHLLPGRQWIIEKGVKVSLRPGHIAVLLRKFTNAQVYLEALQRHNIPCMADGERHFYRRQEVIDVVNVLRVVDDPTDALALVGILRSSLGGLTDQEIMDVMQLGPMDIRQAGKLDEWGNSQRSVIQGLFQRLAWLHAQANRLPIPELLDHLFQQLPLAELAAASSHGEQAVLNVWKLRDLMGKQGAIPSLSFSACVERLVDSLMTHPSEPEAPLAEETLDAVRVLTIHKAKGLEFPVVMLPGLHQKATGPDRGVQITFDWISGLYGCTLPPVWNAGQVPLWEKQRIRETAEQRRVLYVGMTRARERLILSGGILPKPGGESPLNLVQKIVEGECGNSELTAVRVGRVSIPHTVVTPGVLKSVKPPPPPADMKGGNEVVISTPQWDARDRRWQQTNQAEAYLNPSLLHKARSAQEGGKRGHVSRRTSQQLGILMHRALQQWDFQSEPERVQSALVDFCVRHLSEGTGLDKSEVVGELETLFNHFLASPAYRELQRATILGREVPFAVPWPVRHDEPSLPRACVMEGVMDVVYEIDGDVWVGDYKTDYVSSRTVGQRAETYREQAHAYARAASQCLGPAVKGCKLFFIRLGEVVTVAVGTEGNMF